MIRCFSKLICWIFLIKNKYTTHSSLHTHITPITLQPGHAIMTPDCTGFPCFYVTAEVGPLYTSHGPFHLWVLIFPTRISHSSDLMTPPRAHSHFSHLCPSLPPPPLPQHQEAYPLVRQLVLMDAWIPDQKRHNVRKFLTGEFFNFFTNKCENCLNGCNTWFYKLYTALKAIFPLTVTTLKSASIYQGFLSLHIMCAFLYIICAPIRIFF